MDNGWRGASKMKNNYKQIVL